MQNTERLLGVHVVLHGLNIFPKAHPIAPVDVHWREFEVAVGKVSSKEDCLGLHILVLLSNAE